MSNPRYVVVDVNALDEGLQHYVHDEDHVVLPHMIISDLAGNKRREKHAKCLPRWLKQRGDQVWVAQDWANLERLEPSPNDRIGKLGWRDDKESEILRSEGAAASSTNWMDYFRKFSASKLGRTVEDARDSFLSLCQNIGNRLNGLEAHGISKIRSSQDKCKEATELIRKPIMGHVLGCISDRKYHTQAWNDALGRFPDEMAFGRTSRIMCWYSMLEAAGVRSVQDNDFEDATYAHAASYTGYLATSDGRLQQMVKAVFPGVTVLSK